MKDIPQTPAGRTLRLNFGFSIEGLASRDELLFKSLIRLLNHRTQHGWFYTPERTVGQVDMRVVSDHLASTIRARPGPYFQGILTLSAVEQFGVGVLMLPVRADLLEEELNRQGQLIETSRLASQPPTNATQHAAHSASLPRPFGLYPVLGDRPFRLSRWPSPELLNSPGRLRMATLLVGKSMTLTELAQKTGQSLPSCIEFVNTLWRENLVNDGSAFQNGRYPRPQPRPHSDPVVAAAANQRAQPATRSLLARIRARIGL